MLLAALFLAACKDNPVTSNGDEPVPPPWQTVFYSSGYGLITGDSIGILRTLGTGDLTGCTQVRFIINYRVIKKDSNSVTSFSFLNLWSKKYGKLDTIVNIKNGAHVELFSFWLLRSKISFDTIIVSKR